MNLSDVKAKAKKIGVKPCRMKKADLIREIQKAERNLACFGTDPYRCNQFSCYWRDDCIYQAYQT